jgi:hypothetical protein
MIGQTISHYTFGAPGRSQTPSKTAPFSRENLYNHSTTRKANICQFCKNSLLVSALKAASYKKVKICARIQCTLSVKYLAKTVKDILLLLAFGSKILTDPVLISEIAASGD